MTTTVQCEWCRANRSGGVSGSIVFTPKQVRQVCEGLFLERAQDQEQLVIRLQAAMPEKMKTVVACVYEVLTHLPLRCQCDGAGSHE